MSLGRDLKELSVQVLEVNRGIADHKLAVSTWGTGSGLDVNRERMIIKPSGVPYYDLTIDDLVVIDLKSGKRIAGRLNPSVDTKIHLELYRAKEFTDIYGLVHTHSPKAVAFAQAGRPIPILGTTTADYFKCEIPITKVMTKEEAGADVVEKNTGLIILQTLHSKGINPLDCPAILETNHGPFAWGKNPHEALHNAVVLEAIAGMAIDTFLLNPKVEKYAKQASHRFKVNFLRKHGPNRAYGQDAVRKYDDR